MYAMCLLVCCDIKGIALTASNAHVFVTMLDRWRTREQIVVDIVGDATDGALLIAVYRF